MADDSRKSREQTKQDGHCEFAGLANLDRAYTINLAETDELTACITLDGQSIATVLNRRGSM